MKKMLLLGFLVCSLIPTSFVSANGYMEDGSYYHPSTYEKRYLLDVEITRKMMDEGGFSQTFNVTADEGSTVYVGNNSKTDVAGDQNNSSSTAIGNYVDISGDGNTVGQDNTGSAQDADVGTCLTCDVNWEL